MERYLFTVEEQEIIIECGGDPDGELTGEVKERIRQAANETDEPDMKDILEGLIDKL